MADWETRRLGDVARLKMGQSPPGSRVTDLDGGLPFLQGNAEFGSRCPTATLQCDEAARRSGPGDSLISVRAPVGAINRADREYGIGRGLAAVTFDMVDSDFGHHALVEWSRVGDLQRVSQGTTFLAIGRIELAALQFPVPPFEEQRRIAEILDTIDEAIQATEGAIAKLRFAHEALQQQVVPARAIDGVAEAQLGALVDPKRPIVYGILMPGEHVIGGVPVIKVKDIKDGEIASRQTLLHTSPLIDQQYARSRVRKGDLLFTIRGSVGRTAIVSESHDGANITQDTARIAATRVNRSYLVAVMATERFARFVGVHTIGQAVKGINLRELRRAPIPLIGRNEQEIAGAALDGSIASIGAGRERLEKLRLLRTGLAADLLSGRVRTVAA